MSVPQRKTWYITKDDAIYYIDKDGKCWYLFSSGIMQEVIQFGEVMTPAIFPQSAIPVDEAYLTERISKRTEECV